MKPLEPQDRPSSQPHATGRWVSHHALPPKRVITIRSHMAAAAIPLGRIVVILLWLAAVACLGVALGALIRVLWMAV